MKTLQAIPTRECGRIGTQEVYQLPPGANNLLVNQPEDTPPIRIAGPKGGKPTTNNPTSGNQGEILAKNRLAKSNPITFAHVLVSSLLAIYMTDHVCKISLSCELNTPDFIAFAPLWQDFAPG